MTVVRRKKKPEEEKQSKRKMQTRTKSRQGEAGAMVRPSGEYDKNSRPLTAREIAEYERKKKKKKGK
ncbi:hypothetical protein J6O48_08430 [bacterium]|nr:hypothetical protein [bacterium]